MKKVFSLLTSLIMVISLLGILPAMSVGAETTGEYKYNILDDGTIEITDYTTYEIDVKIDIPSEIDGYQVTKIGDRAFYDNYSIIGVTIPETVKSIGDYAFCQTGLSNIIIPDSVTSIGEYAFWGCALRGIIIPDSVVEIGKYAFAYCNMLTSVSLPNSITKISESMFESCEGLKQIIIPDSVIVIDYSAFFCCTNLENIIIPNSVKCISSTAFACCEKLTSVTIPESVNDIQPGAFGYCTSLSDIHVNSNNKYYTSEQGVLFNKDKTKIVIYPIGNVNESYIIPDGVKEIVDYAFESALNLTNVSMPDSVTSIGDWAFSDCESLTSVTIGNSVTGIGEYAFAWCESLLSITIPDSVTSIGSYAFAYCESLKDIYYSGCNNIWDHIEVNKDRNKPLFEANINYSAHEYTSEVTKESTCTETGVMTYTCECGDSYTEEIPLAEHDHGYPAVKNPTCTEAGHISLICKMCLGDEKREPIPALGHTYENGFCIRCNVLEGLKHNVNASNKITITGYEGTLTELEIPSTIDGKSVTCIAENAFSACTKLTSIIIPESITNIGDNAFSNNTRINCYNDSVAHKYAVDNNIKYKLLNASLPGDIYYQYKNDNTMMRFIAEVDIEDVTNANSGEITVSYNEEVLEVKSITGAYKSLYAGGQVITAPEGKCYIISNQYTGFMYDDMMSVEFTLDNYDLGLSRDVIIE